VEYIRRDEKMAIWIDEEENERYRISISDALDYVQQIRLNHPNAKIRMLTNPYNRHVVKIGVIEYDESYGTEVGKEVATVEQLTEHTEAILLKTGDYAEDGRFW
jgi:hypothetical protein